MPELLFYNRPEALNREAHAKLKFTPPKDYSFARQALAVPVMAVEFPFACRQYPIVFTPDPSGSLMAVAILSLAEGGNPFVNDEGQWTASYIPAFIRRYPFVLANIPDKADDFAVAFDAESGCFADDKGEPLFDDKGEPSTFLQAQLQFLQRFHLENQRTQQFMKTLLDESLLRPINIDIVRAGDQAKFGVRNALTVDEQALQKLPADKAGNLLANGFLAAIYAHLISLQNFGAVANRTGNPSSDMIPWWAK